MEARVSVAPRIAIACSGLGHIQRGIESWAADLAQGLLRAGANVTLFAGAPAVGNVDVLPTFHRTGKTAIALASGLRRLGGWRYGMGSPYDVEQTSFALSLWRRIRAGFDILHVQDPTIAMWLERAHRLGVSRPRVIYANGTGENASVMGRFAFLQLLTRATAETWMPIKPNGQAVFLIPNLIDTQRFHPGDKATSRARFGLPNGCTVILCCAAIRRRHKRVDLLLQAFAEVCRETGTDAVLVIAGGRESDTDSLITEGRALLGERVRFLPDLARDVMPDLYRAADGFVLASLQEMFGIVLLEALATGLPVLCNDTRAFRDIAGPGGLFGDLSDKCGLTRGLIALLDPATRANRAQAGRTHVEHIYSGTIVVDAVTNMYNSVLGGASHTSW